MEHARKLTRLPSDMVIAPGAGAFQAFIILSVLRQTRASQMYRLLFISKLNSLHHTNIHFWLVIEYTRAS